MASRGVGAVAARKGPLASQLSCLHVPGSNTPEVGMGISGHHSHPMEKLIPPYKGQLLKGQQENVCAMVGGPGIHRCQWQADVMEPVVAGMREGHQNQSPQGFWMGGQEFREALPCSRPFPSLSVPSPPPPQQGPGSSHHRCVCFFV